MKTVHRFSFWLVLFFMIGSVSSLSAGQSIPAIPFTLKTLEGKIISTDSLKGKPTLVMFWASWCHVCQQELPHVKELFEQKGEKLQFVTIGFSDKEENIRGYVQSHPGTFIFPVAYDQGNVVSEAYRIRGTPTFFLINAKGDLIAGHLGGGFMENPMFRNFFSSL